MRRSWATDTYFHRDQSVSGYFRMSVPIQEIEAGINAVKEQTYAAGLLGQGLLEHQRMLEGLLDELNDPERADQSAELAERVRAELHDLQEQRDKLFHEISHKLSVTTPRASSKRMPFHFSPSPSFKAREDLEQLLNG